ncbi:MAG: AAA family ATPase, partial [Candidatus Dormibacteraceae bacterium]
MRPRQLSITGLRSYRQRTDIDFTQDGLLAIVGDTGAGKSSILEAITYAIYNATTWDQRGVKSLIADGMQTMVVELTFDADGHCFRLRRSTSRGTSPSPVHLLTCDDDPSLPPADGEAQVAAEVRRLVGLDYDGFLAAVVLPQGQFDRLLHARPGERTDLLKGIFRLGELDRVRSGVTEARDTARDLLSALHIERAKLPTDPTADLARAETEAARHKLRVEVLEAVEATLRGSAEAERKAQVDAERLRTTESLVAKSNTRELKTLRALCDVDREIAGRLDELSRERAGWEQRHDAAAAQLAVFEREGRTLAVLHGNREELGKARQLEEAAARREVEVGGWRDKATDASRRVA